MVLYQRAADRDGPYKLPLSFITIDSPVFMHCMSFALCPGAALTNMCSLVSLWERQLYIDLIGGPVVLTRYSRKYALAADTMYWSIYRSRSRVLEHTLVPPVEP